MQRLLQGLHAHLQSRPKAQLCCCLRMSVKLSLMTTTKSSDCYQMSYCCRRCSCHLRRRPLHLRILYPIAKRFASRQQNNLK